VSLLADGGGTRAEWSHDVSSSGMLMFNVLFELATWYCLTADNSKYIQKDVDSPIIR